MIGVSADRGDRDDIHREPSSALSACSDPAAHARAPCDAPASGDAGPRADPAHPRVIPRDAHNISRKDISPSALKVLYRLIGAGYDAYLVGGGVRDLLLGGDPKDFDVATNAYPEEVRELFRNSRLIGRRFRLAHVRFGREIIEVATFRSASPEDLEVIDPRALPSRRRSRATDEPAAARSEDGMILRDNVYGTIEEDAVRRDFTINALYYTPADFSVYDFVGGLEDLRERRIRLIGDPVKRYREDPVRMLRAVRFAAKLNFEIGAETAAPIPELAPTLADVPPARLFDEFVKLFLAGCGERTFELLQRYGLMRMLFPATVDAFDAHPGYQRLARVALANTDARVAEGKPVTPAFLLAALLWPALDRARADHQSEGATPAAALHQAGSEVIALQQHHISVPRRFSTFVREMWELQPRLERPQAKRVSRTAAHPRFRAAFDLLVLRERAELVDPGMGEWWTRYQGLDETGRAELARDLRGGGQRRGGRRRKRSR